MPEVEENSVEWEAPPPPSTKDEPKEEPQMSEVATLGNIFFEPENTFKDLKRKPRFIIAAIIITLLIGAYAFTLPMKIGEEGMRSFISDQVEKRAPGLDRDKKEQQVDLGMKINGFARYAVPVVVFISLFVGGLLYWLGAKAFGGTGGFLQNLSVWVYSSLPPVVIGMVASFIVMALRNADDIDVAASQKGLINQYTNLAFLVGKEHNVLATIISTFDLLAIWGWILAAIGLRVNNKMSKASAWTLVLIIVAIGFAYRVIVSIISGNPT